MSPCYLTIAPGGNTTLLAYRQLPGLLAGSFGGITYARYSNAHWLCVRDSLNLQGSKQPHMQCRHCPKVVTSCSLFTDCTDAELTRR